MTFYVYSTATCSGTYVMYEQNASTELAKVKKWPNGSPMKITIKGGHGLHAEHSGIKNHFYTPRGMMTKVSDEEMEVLLTNESFKRHMNAGFISYEKKPVDAGKKADSMAQKDGSAPLTPGDFKETENSSSQQKVYKKAGVMENAL